MIAHPARVSGVALLVVTATALALAATPAFQTAFAIEEFAARRARVMETLGDAVGVLEGAPERAAELPFRQSNGFFYLTGVEVPRALLLLDGRLKRTTLFLPAHTERRDRKFGVMLVPGDEAARTTGIDVVLDRDQFSAALVAATAGGRAVYAPFRAEVIGGGSADEVTANDVATATDPWDGRPSRSSRFIAHLRELLPHSEMRDLDGVLDPMRLIKSPREIAVIREATDVAVDGIKEAMREAEPGQHEYELQAVAEYVFKKAGAQGPAYFALVATGPDTIYTHYHRGTRVLADGDLVQFDYAPDLSYYVSDVTRVFPANGIFTPRQREWYGIYLRLYQCVMTAIRPHAPIAGIAAAAVKAMDVEMSTYRFTDPAIKASATQFVEQYRTGSNRSLGHWVGMEVHDVGGLTPTLEPGEVFTIEPMMTLPEESLGIRLEDVILMTESGYENLSADAPLEIDAIERLMKEPGISAMRATRDKSARSR